MPCDCHAKSVRQFEVGSGAGTCKATVTVESECDQADLDDENGGDDGELAGGKPEQVEQRSAPREDELDEASEQSARRGCRVTYSVAVSAGSTASAVELTVDGEDFPFLAPIAAGKSDIVKIVRPKPADCEKKKNGKVKLTCAGGKTVVLDKFEICVLS
jgi:hypothetical protein